MGSYKHVNIDKVLLKERMKCVSQLQFCFSLPFSAMIEFYVSKHGHNFGKNINAKLKILEGRKLLTTIQKRK